MNDPKVPTETEPRSPVEKQPEHRASIPSEETLRDLYDRVSFAC